MLNTHQDWKFQSELLLENFIWSILPLLNLQELARQYRLSEQVCDILAIDPQQQLVIIELKNTEDRYIIQQLTRYFAAVEQHRPFQDQVNYQLPIRLVAIAPQFHAHSLIDQDYNRLDVELLTFAISSPQSGQFYFQLRQLKNDAAVEMEIPRLFHQGLYPADEAVPALAPIQLPPPKSLHKLMTAI